jgi:transposase-like protein
MTESNEPSPRPRLKRTTKAERAEWRLRFLQSGQTQEEFATTHGLAPSTLQRWLRQAPSPLDVPRFREVHIAPGVDGWEAEVQLPSGVCIRIRGDLARVCVARMLEGIS